MNDVDLTQYMKETAMQLKELTMEVMRLQEMMKQRVVEDKFLTMAEACLYLKISRATMTKRLSSGEICFATKKGKSWLFPEEKLKAYASGIA